MKVSTLRIILIYIGGIVISVALISFLVFRIILPIEAAFTDTGGGDHAFADWTPANGTTIGGTHTNIHTFTVAAGTAVTANDNTSITALNIVIAGTLTGTGKGGNGWPGGGGGGGGGGAGFTCSCPDCSPTIGRDGGRGGGADGVAVNGINGSAGEAAGGTGGTAGSDPGSHGSFSGNGGTGGGLTSTANGQPGTSGTTVGGYLTAGGNGDTTTDESIVSGSGGGGGGGGGGGHGGVFCGEYGAGGGGGGGGGNGGGRITLVSRAYMKISGTVSSTGSAGASFGAGGSIATGQPANGGNGGNGATNQLVGAAGQNRSHTSGGNGGSGTAGAGGGVLLKHDGTAPIDLTGTIDSRGGNSSTTNGGTVKVFALKGMLPTSVTLNTSKVFGGRYFTSETLSRGRLLSEESVEREGLTWEQTYFEWFLANRKNDLLHLADIIHSRVEDTRYAVTEKINGGKHVFIEKFDSISKYKTLTGTSNTLGVEAPKRSSNACPRIEEEFQKPLSPLSTDTNSIRTLTQN